MSRNVQTTLDENLLIEIRKLIAPYTGLGVVDVLNSIVEDALTNEEKIKLLIKKANSDKLLKKRI